MTKDLLMDHGEEFVIKNGLDGVTHPIKVGLYDDSTDALTDTASFGDITTEPGNASYSRQTINTTARDNAGNWGVDNDTNFVFDFSDTTGGVTVDAAFVVISFSSADTGDTASTDHVSANPALSQSRDIGSIDTLSFAAGDLNIDLN